MSHEHHHTTVREIAMSALDAIGDQQFLSQSRCVDLFLDLQLASDDPFVRWTLTLRLSEIRHLRVVRADEIAADLAAIADLTESPVPHWCDRLVESSEPALRSLAS